MQWEIKATQNFINWNFDLKILINDVCVQGGGGGLVFIRIKLRSSMLESIINEII